jgi:putative glycosyl hydrolase-like family 15 (GHL15) protein
MGSLGALALGCGSSPSEGPSPHGNDDAAANAIVDGRVDGPGGDGPGAIPAADGPSAEASPAPAAGDAGASADATGPNGRAFPDTYATIAVLADQLPAMNAAQQQFAATHYVGTQKQLLGVTHALRALNPNFLVLHYHLAMWQSAPMVTFIVDGMSWGNDYPVVTMHEDWFWHNAAGSRVPSSADGKLLMNVSVAAFRSYWADSLAQQVRAGDYDAIFLDSASPALLQGECGGTDARLAGTAARDTTLAELGNATWISGWEAWMSALSATLAAQGVPLIPNTGPFTTTWDNTNYALTPGIFSEGFADTSFAESDWRASTNELLSLAAADKIMILQNYLSQSSDVAKRQYYLGNYLLVKGHHTYVDYFASGPLEWYPEWGTDLGAPTTAAATQVSALLSGGVYRRDFVKGSVLVNPSPAPVTVQLGGTFQLVVPTGGGAVDSSGTAGGSLTRMPVTAVTVGATSAAIVLR